MADNNKEIGIHGKVTVDQSEAEAGFKGLKSELAGMNAAIGMVHQGVDLLLQALKYVGADMTAIKNAFAGTATNTAEAAKSSEDFGESLEGAAEEAEALAKATKDAGDAAEDLADEAGKAASGVEDASGAAKGASKAVDDLSRATGEAVAEAEELVKATEQTADSVEGVGDATGQVVELGEKSRSLWSEAGDMLKEGFLEGMEQAVEESKKVEARSSSIRGLWERIGHKAIDGLVASLRGLASYMASFVGRANEFDAIFDKMAVRGVAGVEQLRVAVSQLAGALGEDLLSVAESVDLAERLGAGDGAIDAARAAWENYRLTGMDVNRQLEVSTRISKAFNLAVGEQAELIRDVAVASQRAKVSQEELWNAVSSIGPKVQQLGGSFRDLMDVVNTSISAGIKVEESGPAGLEQLLDSLIAPSKEFGEALVATGAIITETSPKWLQLKGDIENQTQAFEALNAEVESYKKLATDIGLLTSQADRLVQKYEELAGKKASGQRLNREERTSFRELTREMVDMNKRASEYDHLTNTVARSDFRRMSAVEQLAERSRRLKDAQVDVNLEMREAQVEAGRMGDSLGGMQTDFQALTETLQTEIPAAIQAVLSEEGGLGKMITKLSELPDALAELPATVQTLVSGVSEGMTQANQAVSPEVAKLGDQFQGLKDQATEAFNELKTNLATIATHLMTPMSDALNKVSQIIKDKLAEPFDEKGTDLYSHVATFAQGLGTKIHDDLDAVMNGEKSLVTVIKGWLKLILDELNFIIEKTVGPMLRSAVDQLKAEWPQIQQELENMFAKLAEVAVAALARGLVPGVKGVLDSAFGGIGNWWYDVIGTSQGTAQTGKLFMGDPAILEEGHSSPGGYSERGQRTVYNNITVNGAQDPEAVADAVSRRQAQQERLGLSRDRVR